MWGKKCEKQSEFWEGNLFTDGNAVNITEEEEGNKQTKKKFPPPPPLFGCGVGGREEEVWNVWEENIFWGGERGRGGEVVKKSHLERKRVFKTAFFFSDE